MGSVNIDVEVPLEDLLSALEEEAECAGLGFFEVPWAIVAKLFASQLTCMIEGVALDAIRNHLQQYRRPGCEDPLHYEDLQKKARAYIKRSKAKKANTELSKVFRSIERCDSYHLVNDDPSQYIFLRDQLISYIENDDLESACLGICECAE